MALSDYEKQVLEQMEAQLRKQDPDLASAMSSSAPDEAKPIGKLRPRTIALGSIIAIVGLAVILGGVSLGYGIWAIVLGILGFGLMVAGVLLALRTTPVDPEEAAASGGKGDSGNGGGGRGPRGPRVPGGGDGQSFWSRFMEDQQKKWDTRDDG